MAKEMRVIGPPGAGKTTTVRNRVARFVADGEYAPEDIMLTSFSKAAAKELAGAVAVPRENVATLHSLARRVVGPQPIAEVGALAKQWDESGIPVGWKIGGRATADVDDGLAADSGDGSMLAAYSLMRSKMVPAEHPNWAALLPFATRWEAFKREMGACDFTDMIYYAIEAGGPAPGEPAVVMVDECLPFDSMVTLADGSQIAIGEIVELRLDVEVLAFNEATGTIAPRRVTGWRKVPLRGREIMQHRALRATEDHPVFTRQFGYVPMKWIDILGCDVLELRHEDLRSERQSHPDRAVDFHRVASWRRVGIEEPRGIRECPREVRSGDRAIRLPDVEVRVGAAMGEIADSRPVRDGIRRDDVQFRHDLASTVHRDSSRAVRRWLTEEADHAGTVGDAGRLGISGVVHGRRQREPLHGGTLDVCTVAGGRGDGGTPPVRARIHLSDQYREEGTDDQVHIEGRCRTSSCDHPVSSPRVRVQANAIQAPVEVEDCHTDRPCSDSLHDLRNTVFENKVEDDMWCSGVHSGTDASPRGSMEEAESSSARKFDDRLRGLREDGNSHSCQAQSSSTENVLTLMQDQVELGDESEDARQSESFDKNRDVYCLDVESDHNFFADGILVHNCQDLTPLSWMLVRHWSIHPSVERFFVMGDPAQCQPPGTQVETSRGFVRIEDLDPDEDRIVGFDPSDSTIRKMGYDFHITSRQFNGRMTTVRTASGSSTRATPDHHWWVKWNEDSRREAHVVYLMQRGDRYRVGWCKLFSGRDSFHLSARARLEKADRIWVLETHRSAQAASIRESYFAAQYGLPTVNWEQSVPSGHYTSEAISGLYGMLDTDEQRQRAERAIAASGREVSLPFWSREDLFSKRGKRTRFIVRTANLLPEYMMLPVRVESRGGMAWSEFTAETEPYSGPVYSLDVDKYHLYFADGILTHNCIYTFAGARPEEMLVPLPEGQSHVLPHSYRMPRAIKEHAERYLAHHSGDLSGGRIYTPRFEDGSKTEVAEGVVRRSSATWRDPDMVVAECERLALEGKSSLILASCAYMLEPTITVLRERGLIYANEWRKSNGRWNPIGAKRDDQTRTADRVAAFYRGESPALWVPMLAADTFHTRGGKKHLEEHPEDWEQWAKPEALAALTARDTHWLTAHVTREYQRPVEYAGRVIARRGPEVLDTPPLIQIGTIHSTKGGQSEHVFIYPDVSVAGADEIYRGQVGRDAAIRLGYVGLTRAREELILCAPAGNDELGL